MDPNQLFLIIVMRVGKVDHGSWQLFLCTPLKQTWKAEVRYRLTSAWQ